MHSYRLVALGVLIVGALLAWFILANAGSEARFATKLGLDLAGGTELIYRADTATIANDTAGALESLREVIERRVNLFGVAEPLVQLEHSSAVAGVSEDRLLVELPGVTDIDAAIAAIGETPLLEFKLVTGGSAETPEFADTGLTGRYLESAQLQFASGAGATLVNKPIVLINFTSEGADLFEKLTSEHVGDTLAIFLDGAVISAPVIQEAIPGGTASITGDFTAESARDLVRNLNFGALPVPIQLVGSNTVGATLGAGAFDAGIMAGTIGFAAVVLFMLLWYRFAGLVASLALVVYILIMVAVIKFVPITLTASGLAGFILSIGMAVDANVLIFERIKEELRLGKGTREAAHIGFARAWPAIRDGHLTMIISSVILFWLGTSIVQGFALVFGFGVLASLLTAVTVSRVFLLAILPEHGQGVWRFLMKSGVTH